ncbi:MAG: SulP family sulfate permease [Oleispira sp.]|jgi:SulP family sulfate permease
MQPRSSMRDTMRLDSFLPFLRWVRVYNRETFIRDAVAALIITMMMIPQSLAYALLAGLPPQLGLYASMLPLLLYALVGSSSALSVGPFAISSIMTATALSIAFPESRPEEYLVGAVVLALSSGIMLLMFGLLRLGFLSNFLSFPVITGFISASAIVIAASQIGNLTGLDVSGGNLLAIFSDLGLHGINLYTMGLGTVAVLMLYFLPDGLKKLSTFLGIPTFWADILSKSTPILVMSLSVLVVVQFDLQQQIAVVGIIPQGLPVLDLPDFNALNWSAERWQGLLGSAALISLIGYVSALSVAQSFAAKRRQRVDPNQEAIGLGLANLASGISGAFPISASMSRSAVSFKAGAQTPAAGALAALAIGLSTVFMTPLLYYVPIASLAAMIMVAIISLVDIPAIKRVWSFNRSDFSALALTALVTLIQGVELGLISGVVLSILLYLYRSSTPHIAVIGRIPSTEHFRNRLRHQVELSDKVIGIRIDASLYFANARVLEDEVNSLLAQYPDASHLVLQCSSISDIDTSALESLRSVDRHLRDADMQFHLSEVKGPVMDQLLRSDFIATMSGKVFISHYLAWKELS